MFDFFVDSDPAVRIDLEALVRAWGERLPLDVESIKGLRIGERVTINKMAPYVAVERVS